MAEVIQMPKLSDTMEEGTVLTWYKQKGDKIEAGEVLADIETDKATLELESYFDGVIVYQIATGETVPIGTPIAVIAEEGEEVDVEALLAEYGGSASGQEEKSEPQPETTGTSTEVVETRETDETDKRIKISPVAKKLAREHHIDLNKVKGSGPNNRIVKRDIEAILEEIGTSLPSATTPSSPVYSQPAPQSSSATTVQTVYEDVPTSGMRKTIARRLSESKFSAPHFYLTVEVDMENAAEFREQLKEVSEIKISFNDLLIKACALALKKHPKVNASWYGDFIRYYKEINVGVAVGIEDGLVVPVIKNADAKGLEEIATEMREFIGKAKDKKLQPTDFEGSTFSISNLGMFGIDEFTAIINPPNAVILAVGQIQEKPVVVDGEIVARKRMRMTLSCDHRVVDGVLGAQFLQTLKALLEEPLKMLL